MTIDSLRFLEFGENTCITLWMLKLGLVGWHETKVRGSMLVWLSVCKELALQQDPRNRQHWKNQIMYLLWFSLGSCGSVAIGVLLTVTWADVFKVTQLDSRTKALHCLTLVVLHSIIIRRCVSRSDPVLAKPTPKAELLRSKQGVMPKGSWKCVLS